MLFAPGMGRLFATHPPLLARLKAIDPHFDASEIEAARARLTTAALAGRPEAEAGAASAPRAAAIDAAASIAQLVGVATPAHMQRARTLREALPEAVLAAGAHPSSARALLLTLALDADSAARERQKRFLAQQLGAQLTAEIDRVQADVDALEPEQRLPALLRTLPTLRQMAREERQRLLAALNAMLQREGGASVWRYALRKLVQVNLRDELDPAARLRALTLDAVMRDVQVVLSVLAHHGCTDAAAARRAYEIGAHHLYPRERPAYDAPASWQAPLDAALSRLDRLTPLAKEQLVEALVKTVLHDERTTIGEVELLRTVCATLHCPLPPLLLDPPPSPVVHSLSAEPGRAG